MPRLMAIGGWPPSSAAHCSPHLSTPTIIVAALPLGTTWTFQLSLLQTRSTSVIPQARGTADGPFVGGLLADRAARRALGDQAQWPLPFAVTAWVATLRTLESSLA